MDLLPWWCVETDSSELFQENKNLIHQSHCATAVTAIYFPLNGSQLIFEK